MADQAGQSADGQGSDLRSIANQIEGLLDDDGHYNPNPNQVSRGHPDYDESTDERVKTPGQDRDDRGRFTKQSAPEPDEETDDTANADQLADTEETTDDTETGDTEEVSAESAETESEQEGEGTDTINTLAELAEALDMPIEDMLGQLTHTFRAADEDVTVNLAELTSGYQKDADYRRGTSRLADERRSLETAHAARMRQFEQENMSMAQQLNGIEQMFTAQLEDPALQQLRDRDPAEWNARQTEIGNQIGHLRNIRQQAAQRYDAFMQENLRQLQEREVGYVREKITDFNDSHADTARKTMQSLGYNEQEIGDMYDHRIVLAALELDSLRNEVETLRAQEAKAKDTVKRIKKEVPKLTKPGKQKLRTNQGIKRDRLAKLKARAKKSGSVEDAAAIIETML